MIHGAGKGNQKPGNEALSIKELSKQFPTIKHVLEELGVSTKNDKSISLAFLCEDAGVNPKDVFDILDEKTRKNIVEDLNISSLTIIPGTTKDGKPEYKEPVTIQKGEIIALTGPTGSGKSQFLNDIEGLAQEDTPSKRKVLLNEIEIDDELRINQAYKPIAQISQNMNYLLDVSVEEFIEMHFESRGIEISKKLKNEVLDKACSLSGEPFGLNTPLVSLSGGQSRALMIADAVLVSKSPIILVDEIENAGIDKPVAIQLLLKEGNITIIATHDPLIALMAHKRFVFKNGGISEIICRTDEEQEVLEFVTKIEHKMDQLKYKLRTGQTMNTSEIPLQI